MKGNNNNKVDQKAHTLFISSEKGTLCGMDFQICSHP